LGKKKVKENVDAVFIELGVLVEATGNSTTKYLEKVTDFYSLLREWRTREIGDLKFYKDFVRRFCDFKAVSPSVTDLANMRKIIS